MNSVPKYITFDQAKKRAENAVMEDVAQYETSEVSEPLEGEYFEGEYCWIFLRNKGIAVSPRSWFTREYGAYAISKKGGFSQVLHFSYDYKKLQDYSQIMSNYFKEKNE